MVAKSNPGDQKKKQIRIIYALTYSDRDEAQLDVDGAIITIKTDPGVITPEYIGRWITSNWPNIQATVINIKQNLQLTMEWGNIGTIDHPVYGWIYVSIA